MENVYDKTIDLHGQTVAEALQQLDYLLNRNPGQVVLVIHGHGSGRLRSAIRKYLCEHELVQAVRFGEDVGNHAGSGVTIVEIADYPL